jgi:hypothetical protein
MKLRYFVVDAAMQLRKASQASVRGLWQGRRGAEALGCPSGKELRLVSVVCGDGLLPERVYLLRVPLTGGFFTDADSLVLQALASPDCVTPAEAIRHHTGGWPPDFFRQLAVALDVPVASLDVPFGVGGPLLAAAALRVSPGQALRHPR